MAVTKELVTLMKILEELKSISEFQKDAYPAPIGPKPVKDLWNMGTFITNVTLPSRQWTTIWNVSRAPCPIMVYWKTVVCDTPNFLCLCFQDGIPVCDTGCECAALWALGITQPNERGWVHLYDMIAGQYGLQCNILRPIKESYEYRIFNEDLVDRNLILCYPKWYQWSRPIGL